MRTVGEITKIRIKISGQGCEIFREMAKEAGCEVEDLAQIAVYNLIACWLSAQQDKKDTNRLAADRFVAIDTHDDGVPGGEPVDAGVVGELSAPRP